MLPTMYATPRPNGSWELRESRATPRGPRSRTLATFRVLDADAIDRALERSSTSADADDVRAAARRAGAPVAPDSASAAAGSLLRELASGNAPSPALRRAQGAALAGEPPAEAARWLGASPERRGRALHDLLLLADRIPRRRAPARKSRFPRLATR
jgi:hypothetical protein